MSSAGEQYCHSGEAANSSNGCACQLAFWISGRHSAACCAELQARTGRECLVNTDLKIQQADTVDLPSFTRLHPLCGGFWPILWNRPEISRFVEDRHPAMLHRAVRTHSARIASAGGCLARKEPMESGRHCHCSYGGWNVCVLAQHHCELHGVGAGWGRGACQESWFSRAEVSYETVFVYRGLVLVPILPIFIILSPILIIFILILIRVPILILIILIILTILILILLSSSSSSPSSSFSSLSSSSFPILIPILMILILILVFVPILILIPILPFILVLMERRSCCGLHLPRLDQLSSTPSFKLFRQRCLTDYKYACWKMLRHFWMMRQLWIKSNNALKNWVTRRPCWNQRVLLRWSRTCLVPIPFGFWQFRQSCGHHCWRWWSVSRFKPRWQALRRGRWAAAVHTRNSWVYFLASNIRRRRRRLKMFKLLGCRKSQARVVDAATSPACPIVDYHFL